MRGVLGHVTSWRLSLAAVVCLTLVVDPGPAAQAAGAVMRYVHNGPESPLDRRYTYQWAILAAALERTRAAYGPYSIDTAEFMTETRQRFELARASGRLSVMYLGTTPEMERELTPIRIPVDLNLGGYSVFLIKKNRQAEFASVRSLDDLRRFSFGLGLGWLDADILRASRLKVVTGSSYNGLFEMAENARFDAFPRAAVEVLDEYALRKDAMQSLAIERELVLSYPMPMYFWFSSTAEGRRLAERAEAGMRLMLGDGSYARVFRQYQDRKIRTLDLMGRRVITIPNPFLSPDTPFADRRLWFDPRSYRAGKS
ncbi:MAG TPA: hypothetical protein VN700_16130 [Vicinamibacterales bacterium]|nr:hypothetical protein [Vicinamibacterales bacterium]